MFGFDRAIANPIRPRLPFGIPSSSENRFHVAPPSYVTCSPELGPPELKNHGQRRYSHMAAKSLFGLAGSMTRSAAPVRSSTYNTFVHVLPPSVVLKTPRSAFCPHA